MGDCDGAKAATHVVSRPASAFTSLSNETTPRLTPANTSPQSDLKEEFQSRFLPAVMREHSKWMI